MVKVGLFCTFIDVPAFYGQYSEVLKLSLDADWLLPSHQEKPDLPS